VTNLYFAATYRRRVGASLSRIWDNVVDWEHLPALHSGSFNTVELIDADSGGWRIRLTPQPGSTADAQVLRLATDRARHCYLVTTEAGHGASSEIRVALTPYGPDNTGVVAEYHVPVSDPGRRAMIGAGFIAAYQILWDEDEAMMRVREAALAAVGEPTPLPERVELGPVADLVLPRVFAFGPGRFRLLDLDGRLVAHSVTCQHWLGPLDQAVVDHRRIRCPWHGCAFDVATGRSADGRGMRLAFAPAVGVENGIVVAHRA